MSTIRLKVDGMTCGHCVRGVESALRKVEGVKETAVELGSATVEFDPAETNSAALVQAVLEEGYRATVAPSGN